MDLKIHSGKINRLITQFESLSRKPSLENVALKLEPLNEAVAYCLKFPTQIRQAHRVCDFLADVMADDRQEESIQLVASMAVQTLMQQIVGPTDKINKMVERPRRVTNRWNMASAPKRVHAQALLEATRSLNRSAALRDDLKTTQRHLADARKKQAAQATPKETYRDRRKAAEEGSKRHQAWKPGAKKAVPVT